MNAIINYAPIYTITHQVEAYAEGLDNSVPALVIKKQYVLEVGARGSADSLEMRTFIARIYLLVLEEIGCPYRLGSLVCSGSGDAHLQNLQQRFG